MFLLIPEKHLQQPTPHSTHILPLTPTYLSIVHAPHTPRTRLLYDGKPGRKIIPHRNTQRCIGRIGSTRQRVAGFEHRKLLSETASHHPRTAIFRLCHTCTARLPISRPHDHNPETYKNPGSSNAYNKPPRKPIALHNSLNPTPSSQPPESSAPQRAQPQQISRRSPGKIG